MEAEMQQNAIINSNISKEKWQLEVEGIAHKLKIGKNQGEGGKEWRTHLEQTRTYAGKVSEKLPELRAMLERLQDDASRALEKISRKEAILSRNFQGMTGDYRAHTDQLREI
jgi:estrogen-related receptor beta like 1